MSSTLAPTPSGLQTMDITSRDRLYGAIYWLMAAAVTGFLGWNFITDPLFLYSLNNDFWEHSATLREWMRDLWSPDNPHLATDTGSPRYMPFYLVLAALGRTFELGAITVLKMGALFNVALLTIGIFLFFRLYFRSSLAPLIGLLVLLCGWGMAWTWSNVYQLRGLLYVAPYPSTFAMAATLVCLWLQVSILRAEAPSGRHYAGLTILVAVTFASHPLTGAFAIGAAGLLALTHPETALRTRIMAIATLGAGLLLAELWPYYSVLQVTLGVSGGEAQSWVSSGDLAWDARPRKLLNHPFYAPATVLGALGPALAGLICLGLMVRRRDGRFILLGTLSMLVPYGINLVYAIPLGHRFLLFAIFFLHLAMVWGLLELVRCWSRQKSAGGVSLPIKAAAGLSFAVLSSAVLFNVAFTQFDIHIHKKRAKPVTVTMAPLLRMIPRDAVVMAKPLLAWPVPTFGGKVVSLFHPNPMVPDQAARKRDVARFFDADTTVTDRAMILKRYRVTHILIDSADTGGGLRTYLYRIGNVTQSRDNLQLISLPAARR